MAISILSHSTPLGTLWSSWSGQGLLRLGWEPPTAGLLAKSHQAVRLDQLLQEYFETGRASFDEVEIDPAKDAEEAINALRDQIRKDHLKSVQKGDYKPAAGLSYSNIFSSLERVGDHVINVSEAVTGINLN